MEIIQIKFKERLIIRCDNQPVVIQVHDNKGYQGVKLHIEAPQNVMVNREEIARLKKEQARNLVREKTEPGF